MKSVTESSARRTIGAGLTEAKRRRRWPRVLLWVVSFALIADVIGFMVYVSRYQPLRDGAPAGVDQRQVAQELRAIPPGGRAFSQYRVDDLRGTHLWFSFTLMNTGRLPVTITSVGPPPPEGGPPPLEQTGVRIGPDDESASAAAEATSFEPFSLDAGGGTRLIVIDARFARCRGHEGGGARYYGAVPVAYEVLGFYGRTTTVTLPYTIEVPMDAACDTNTSKQGDQPS
jgi:hypothetical protein